MITNTHTLALFFPFLHLKFLCRIFSLSLSFLNAVIEERENFPADVCLSLFWHNSLRRRIRSLSNQFVQIMFTITSRIRMFFLMSNLTPLYYKEIHFLILRYSRRAIWKIADHCLLTIHFMYCQNFITSFSSFLFSYVNHSTWFKVLKEHMLFTAVF